MGCGRASSPAQIKDRDLRAAVKSHVKVKRADPGIHADYLLQIGTIALEVDIRNLDTALADLASPALESGNLKPPWFDHSGITNSHNGSRQCYSLQPTSA